MYVIEVIRVVGLFACCSVKMYNVGVGMYDSIVKMYNAYCYFIIGDVKIFVT